MSNIFQNTRRLTAALLTLLLTLSLAACQAAEIPQGPLERGSPYRDFTMPLLGGGEFTLSENEGKVVLLNFWATWCGPCVGEMPAFPRLVEKYGDDLVLVAVDRGEDEATVQNFMEENGYTFPVILDEGHSLNESYPTDSIPYTVIIGRDGTVAHIQLGAFDADTMFDRYSAMIDGLLA